MSCQWKKCTELCRLRHTNNNKIVLLCVHIKWSLRLYCVHCTATRRSYTSVLCRKCRMLMIEDAVNVNRRKIKEKWREKNGEETTLKANERTQAQNSKWNTIRREFGIFRVSIVWDLFFPCIVAFVRISMDLTLHAYDDPIKLCVFVA